MNAERACFVIACGQHAAAIPRAADTDWLSAQSRPVPHFDGRVNAIQDAVNDALRPAAQNVIQMKPAPPAYPPRMMPPPEVWSRRIRPLKVHAWSPSPICKRTFLKSSREATKLLCRSGVAKQKCVDSLLAKARYWPFCFRLRSWGCRGLRTMSGWFGS